MGWYCRYPHHAEFHDACCLLRTINRLPTLGKKIHRLRTERGLTLSQLAKKIHVSSVTIHNIEYDIYEPKISTLLNLCEALEISLDYLIDSESDWLFTRIQENDPDSIASAISGNGHELPNILRLSLSEGECRKIKSAAGKLLSLHVVFGRIDACACKRMHRLVAGDNLHVQLYDDLLIKAMEASLLVAFSQS